MTLQTFSLSQLGWKAFFQQQLTLEDLEQYQIFRIVEQQRSGYVVASEQQSFHLDMHHQLTDLTVGDWILLDDNKRWVKSLERTSLFARKAVGEQRNQQLIAANVDTAFIVSSLNDDFNLSRIERYLAVAREAEVEPVIVLTKVDLCDQAEERKQQVQSLSPDLVILTVNGLDHASVTALYPWCKLGQTVAFLGSSGVGKSTLVNGLLKQEIQSTGSAREQDSKGRHTTTSRSIHVMPEGALLLDTPGMRELQIVDCEDGVMETFSDVADYASQCRFSDCQHHNEPGCAINAALDRGDLDSRRVNNFFKLLREQARNSASIAEKHEYNRNLGKMYRRVQSEASQRKKGY